MENLPWHPHYDVWALIITLVIFFEFSSKNEILKKKKRNIKALLLDQSFVSGLGNIYVDESLWESEIHPNSISCAIPEEKIFKLHRAIQSILSEAIKQLGTTFISFSFLNGRSGNYSNELKIFGKQGETCRNCGSIIKKIKVAGRGTHVCTKCQKTNCDFL